MPKFTALRGALVTSPLPGVAKCCLKRIGVPSALSGNTTLTTAMMVPWRAGKGQVTRVTERY
jgi:hypothetical protein